MKAKFYDTEGKLIRTLENVISQPSTEKALPVVRKGFPTLRCVYVETVEEDGEQVVKYMAEK